MIFSSDMSKEDFFSWLQDRFIHVYREDKNYDFVQRLTDPKFFDDKDTLTWIYERIYFIYGESVKVDFMRYLNNLWMDAIKNEKQ